MDILPTFRHEKMSDIFHKYHIEGLPFPAVLHHFTKPDTGDPHDHPFGFTTHILKGGYMEDVYEVNPNNGQWLRKQVWRRPGSAHEVKATDIHKIIDLPKDGCWTLMLPEPWERKSGFWQSGEWLGVRQARFREWDQPEFN